MDTHEHGLVQTQVARGSGRIERQQPTLVATDGGITPGPVPETKAVTGGFSIIEVPTREEALIWAA